jgi:hypothetical protein
LLFISGLFFWITAISRNYGNLNFRFEYVILILISISILVLFYIFYVSKKPKINKPTPEYTLSSPEYTLSSEIENLSKLHEMGKITDAEYQAAKDKLLK